MVKKSWNKKASFGFFFFYFLNILYNYNVANYLLASLKEIKFLS